MRWRIDLSYDGTDYYGWQKQPGDRSVQETLERSFETILRETVEITGCGRTDTGVHARHYVAHLDVTKGYDLLKTIYQVNAVLPHDIAIQKITPANDSFHARYDAVKREYKYYIHFEKDPFLQKTSFQLPAMPDKTLMQEAAAILLKFEDFKPFCKTGSDATHFKCKIFESAWEFSESSAIYTISANRFLRGMVRLIVGACLNTGLKKLKAEDIEQSLRLQSPLPIQWSVPPHGLFLEKVLF